MSGAATVERKRSPAPLWATVAIFAVSVLAAWFFFLNPQYLPSGRTNNGDLIQPVAPLPADLDLRTPQGEAFDPEALSGKWTLMFLDGGDCNDACIARLTDMRQIRLALGESRIDVERMLMTVGKAAPVRAAELAAALDGMKVVVLDAAGGDRILDLLGGGTDAMDRVYILDPMQNLMMRYRPDAPAQDILKDMERLLKASKNWIRSAQYGHK